MHSRIALILWIIALLFNAFDRFLPLHKWTKSLAIIIAIFIALFGAKQAINEYRNYRFAHVEAKSGRILEKKNFPWDITKIITQDGGVMYCVNERWGDPSEILIKPDKKISGYSIQKGYDGVYVKFTCSGEIPNFKIEIK